MRLDILCAVSLVLMWDKSHTPPPFSGRFTSGISGIFAPIPCGIESLIRDGFDIVQIARSLGTNVNLLLLKLQQMNDDNHLHLPDMPSRNFLGTISDDAGHL